MSNVPERNMRINRIPCAFRIKGQPISKDNFKCVNRQGRVFLSSKYKDYERDIAYQFLMQFPNFEPTTEKLSMKLVFNFKDNRRCDLSNAPKSVLDALQGYLYVNDKQIMRLDLSVGINNPDNPGIQIEVNYF